MASLETYLHFFKINYRLPFHELKEFNLILLICHRFLYYQLKIDYQRPADFNLITVLSLYF